MAGLCLRSFDFWLVSVSFSLSSVCCSKHLYKGFNYGRGLRGRWRLRWILQPVLEGREHGIQSFLNLSLHLLLEKSKWKEKMNHLLTRLSVRTHSLAIVSKSKHNFTQAWRITWAIHPSFKLLHAYTSCCRQTAEELVQKTATMSWKQKTNIILFIAVLFQSGAATSITEPTQRFLFLL